MGYLKCSDYDYLQMSQILALDNPSGVGMSLNKPSNKVNGAWWLSEQA